MENLVSFRRRPGGDLPVRDIPGETPQSAFQKGMELVGSRKFDEALPYLWTAMADLSLAEKLAVDCENLCAADNDSEKLLCLGTALHCISDRYYEPLGGFYRAQALYKMGETEMALNAAGSAKSLSDWLLEKKQSEKTELLKLKPKMENLCKQIFDQYMNEQRQLSACLPVK